MTFRLAPVLAGLTLAAALLPATAAATAPALQLSPLQYEDSLGKTVKTGHIDVSNPTDGPLQVQTSVKGFRQQGTNGDLQFYDDADLDAAITTDLSDFAIGPREAIRVVFSVNPAKLPAGGTYAAIFFRTQPAPGSSSSSYISESANLGTLLILRNGAAVAPKGGLSGLTAPFWQFHDGLSGTARVVNNAPAHGGVAFRPQLSARVLPWGQSVATATGLVLPGATRRFAVSRPGSFFGLLPLTVTDSATHSTRTALVLACTGIYRWLAPLLLVLLLAVGIWWVRRPRRRAVPVQPAPAPAAIPQEAPASRSLPSAGDTSPEEPPEAKSLPNQPDLEPQPDPSSQAITVPIAIPVPTASEPQDEVEEPIEPPQPAQTELQRSKPKISDIRPARRPKPRHTRKKRRL